MSSSTHVYFLMTGPLFQQLNVSVYLKPQSAVICGNRGHNGKVRSLSWSPDDTRLASTGVDGAVYEWRISTMKRERENVLKVKFRPLFLI